ncbi:MAG: carotenoid 1,2-hydratase [Pseudomonadota bacterium]|nr:carotenoid 1,2-hydratase [Pseudomonadota bacterium]
MLTRRALTLAGLASPLAGAASIDAATTSTGPPPTALGWPRDYGAHQASKIEWWYLTGHLNGAVGEYGFQLTFFRAATGIAGAGASRFAASELVFAHAAVSDIAGARLRHDQRIARSGFGIATAASDDTRVVLRDWRLERGVAAGRSRYRAHAGSDVAGFAFALQLDATQPVLLQGVDGLSRKGPDPAQSSRYYSEPQLTARGSLAVGGAPAQAVGGRAWLDHEWSDSFLDSNAVGWDWIGMNLDDGAALTAFRLRRADGTKLWAGGSYRAADGMSRNFAAGDVAFVAGRTWQSPASKAVYPVEWSVATPAGTFVVKAMLDDQELDSRASTGAIYWEGLSRLFGSDGRELGRGYLEMTGYAARLRL